MKVIIQIPCYNEADTLEYTLNQLPTKLEGVDKIEILIIDDGSTDDTVKVAKRWGIDHIISFPKNKGLAKSFAAGLDEAVRLKADIIVNTDADNQYNADDIQKLIDPIIKGKADFIVGERPIQQTSHFSYSKKILQKLGSKIVRFFSNTEIPDAPSGFRAISKEAALRMNVFNEYTYTLETIIQAGRQKWAIQSVPVKTNDDLRPSRLFSNIFIYIRKSIITILRIFYIYKPLKTFLFLGLVFFIPGFILSVRWLWLFFIIHSEKTHLPSIILATIFLITGFLFWGIGILSDILSINRKLLEDIQYRLRKIESEK